MFRITVLHIFLTLKSKLNLITMLRVSSEWYAQVIVTVVFVAAVLSLLSILFLFFFDSSIILLGDHFAAWKSKKCQQIVLFTNFPLMTYSKPSLFQSWLEKINNRIQHTYWHLLILSGFPEREASVHTENKKEMAMMIGWPGEKWATADRCGAESPVTPCASWKMPWR